MFSGRKEHTLKEEMGTEVALLFLGGERDGMTMLTEPRE